MAVLSKTGITTGATIQVGHVTQSVDAFTGLVSYDITLSGSLTLTGSLNQSGSVRVSNAITASTFTGSFIGPLTGTSSAAQLLSNTNPSYLPSGSVAVTFLNGSLGVLAGSTKLSSGISAVINPTALTGKRFQTQYWVTVTKASGSTSPGNNALMVQEIAPNSGTFLIKDIAATTNDDVNFIIVYT
jgi:hypothetical protein